MYRYFVCFYCVFYCFFSINSFAASGSSEKLYDPTTPLRQIKKKADAPVSLNLSAIANMGGKPFAIINGKRVVEGDSLGFVKITQVGQGYVTYTYNGKSYKLRMRKSIIQ